MGNNPFEQFDLEAFGNGEGGNALPASNSLPQSNPFEQFDNEAYNTQPTKNVQANIIPKNNKVSKFESSARGVLQGRLFNVADELSAGIATPIDLAASVYYGEKPSISQSYDRALNETRKQDKKAATDNPNYYLGGQIAGALGTGAALAGTAPAKALGNVISTGKIAGQNLGLAGRVLGRATGGAIGAGAYGLGEGEGLQDRLQKAKEYGVFGGVAGVAIPAGVGASKYVIGGGKNLVQGIRARSPEVLQDTTKVLDKTAVGYRNQMRELGAAIKPEATNKLLKNINYNLAGVKLIPELSLKTIAIVKHIKAATKNGISVDDLDQYRRLLRATRDEDEVASGAVRKAIDDTLNALGEKDFTQNGKQAVSLLNKFRKDYTQASKFEDITDILVKADGDPNKIKSGLTRYLNNGDNTQGWSKEEILLLKTAARSNVPEKMLKMFGKLGIDLGTSTTPGNTVAPLVGTIAGASVGGAGVAAIPPVLGTIAKQGQKYLARGKAENLLNTIQRGSKFTADDLLKIIKQGGKVTAKDIGSLQPKEAQKFMDALKAQQSTPIKRAIINNLNNQER